MAGVAGLWRFFTFSHALRPIQKAPNWYVLKDMQLGSPPESSGQVSFAGDLAFAQWSGHDTSWSRLPDGRLRWRAHFPDFPNVRAEEGAWKLAIHNFAAGSDGPCEISHRGWLSLPPQRYHLVSHAPSFSATTGKIWKVSPPTAIGMRDQDHDRCVS